MVSDILTAMYSRGALLQAQNLKKGTSPSKPELPCDIVYFRTAIILPLANMLMATFSGLVCFSVLGNMAYTYGVDITEVINAGVYKLTKNAHNMSGTGA